MICEHCGTERQKYQLDEEGRCRTAETLPQCRDAISVQLASMTKRAEEAEVWGQDTVCRLTNEKEAAETKLATVRKNYFDLCDAVCRESTSVEDACRQAWETRARLASMTKRAEEAERKRVDGDPSIPMTPYDYGYEQGTADAYSIKMHDAEAKLATAVEALETIESYVDGYLITASEKQREIARAAIHAIGIDPSKEQGK